MLELAMIKGALKDEAKLQADKVSLLCQMLSVEEQYQSAELQIAIALRDSYQRILDRLGVII